MKRLICMILGVLTLMALASCGDDDIEIGGDWHVWGLYDFDHLNGMTVAVGRVYDDESHLIGYDIYSDGESAPGPNICEMRCTDGGYTYEDMSTDYSILVKDYNGDGSEDLGMELANGDVLWYIGVLDENGSANYAFTEVEKATVEN